jgi:hypothetical protein
MLRSASELKTRRPPPGQGEIMRRLPLLLTTLVFAAPARAEDGETAKDERSGLVIEVPEQWSRESAREKGSIKFAAIYDLNRTKYVIFSVETGPATGFDEGPWLANEKAGHAKLLKTTDTPWTTEPTMVGGVRATRYTVGGKTEQGADMRIRGCGFVHNDVFFRILEISSGGAHAEAADAIKAIWDAVKFEEANPFADEEKKEEEGSGEEEESSGGEDKEAPAEEAPKGESIVVEDKAGNFKVSVPAGWTLERTPQEDDGAGLRVVARRLAGEAEVAVMEIHRIRVLRADFFEQNEAGDAVEKAINGELKLFDRFYGEDYSKIARPQIDPRSGLGKGAKTCGFEVRAIPLAEEAKIEEAKKLIQRGDTSVTVPEFKEFVVRGRLAMLSPYIYVTFVWTARSLSDDEKLLAEINAFHDSFEFAMAEGMPPALESDTAPFGNTLADPKNAAERKATKVHEYKKGAKVAAALQFTYVLPPGFQEAERVKDPVTGGVTAIGDQWAVQIVAQDGNNGWVWIKVLALSSKGLPSNTGFEDKKKVFETWISNFESNARGAGKMPKKPEKIKIGSIDGDGCELEGKITGFTATELNMVTDMSGWRIQFEMKTRGTGSKTFAEGIKTFLKKFKAAKK